MAVQRRRIAWTHALALGAFLQSCQSPSADAPMTAPNSVPTFARGATGPTVSAANPASARQGTVTLDVQISGSGFDQGSQASWQLNGVTYSKIAVNSTKFVSSTSLTANITVAVDAAPVNYDIAVTTSTANALVTECSDSYLNDMQGRHVRQQHVREAIERAASGPVQEGTVGAGTGMSLFGFKGGIGTASRRLPDELDGFTVGAIVLGNFGRRDQLTIAGVPVGRALSDWQPPETQNETGSCIVLLATDAPMLDRTLRRLARRAALGLARTGSIAGNGSGDFVVAFSNALRLPHDSEELLVTLQHVTEGGRLIDALFQASVEATEEAVINALFRATTLDGWDGHVRHALPLDLTLGLLRKAGALHEPS